MADLDYEIEGYEPPQLDDDEVEGYEPPKAKVRPVKPVKPKKNLPPEKKQVFKPQLPPAIGEGPKFKFDQSPFKTTDEERARLTNPNLKSIRSATSEEAEQLKRIEKEQNLYDIYGPTTYSVREGINRAILSTQGQLEDIGQKGKRFLQDWKNLLTGNITGALAPEETPAPPTRLASQDITRSPNEPPLAKAIPPVLETTLPALAQELLLRAGSPRVEVPRPIPELAPPGAPRQLGPGRVIEGASPVETPPPTSPQAPLQLRQGRTIVGFPPAKPPVRPTRLPPGPNELARLSPGRMGPLADMGIASTRAPMMGLDPATADMTFDLLPSLRPGQAPVMLVPPWVISAATGGPLDKFGGVNFKLEDVPWLTNQIAMSAPSIDHWMKATESLDELVKASESEGVGTISIVAQGMSPQERAEVIPHETFHAGQAQVSGGGNWHIHDPEWAKNHPVIKGLLEADPLLKSRIAVPGSLVAAEDILATELPTYVMGGQGRQFFKTSGEGIDFLFDYLNHIIERKGVEAIDTLEKTARVRPEIADALPLARSMYESWQRERAERNLQSLPGGSQSSDIGPGISGAGSTGIEPRGGETAIDAPGGEIARTSGVPTKPTRELALDRFLSESAVKVPVYHGTQSSTEITQVDPVKFDEDALYGPGFYTTQASHIAAGEGGYVDTKLYKARSDDEINQEIERRLIEAGVMTLGEDLTGLSLRVAEREGENSPKIGLIDRIAEEVQATGYGNTPHAYKVYLDIKNPFDIDGQPDSKLTDALDDLTGFDYPVMTDGRTPNVDNNAELYQLLTRYFGNKIEVNEWLQDQGYDGITHIGGMNQNPKLFDTESEAIVYAEQAGGKVIPPQNLQTSVEGPFQDVQVFGGDKWSVQGHKVWIAFKPQQVKSATGNIGTFDPTKPEMSLSTKPSQTDPMVESFLGDLRNISDEIENLQGKREELNQLATEAYESGDIAQSDKLFSEHDLAGRELTKLRDKKFYVEGRIKELKGISRTDVESFPLSTRSPVNEGDLVRVKGYSNNAEVTQMLPGGGVEVKFPDGTIDEFDFDQVTKIAPKATPKVPESNEKREALKETPIVNSTIGESLPGIEAPVKMESDIGFPPPTQPPLEGMGSGIPPLRRKIISPEINEALVGAFTKLLEAGGVKPNPLIPPFLQVRQAVLDGKIAGKELGRLLDENGITAEEFADEWAETASVAGRILSELSRVENDQLQIVNLMKKDPQLAKKIFPAKQRMEAILRDVETTQLGKSFWQRAGDLAQQLMLSDIRIAIRNAIVTTGRIPVIAIENITGAWLKAITEGKYKGKTLQQVIESARSDAMTGLEVAAEMISAFKPGNITQIMISGQDATRMKYDEAITQLQKTFPQLHRELITPGFGPEMLEKGKESVEIARGILMDMRTDVKKRDEFVRRLDTAEKRLKSNVKGLGRVLNTIGYPLDHLLRPANWAEMFFRQPLFYGHLNMRMKLEGQDLAGIIRDGKFDEIPEEILKDSVDEALFATHAYMPRAERGRVESTARGMVMALNKIKLAAPFTQQWFPRALYTSLKFAYEYVPLTPLIGGIPFGTIKPAMRVLGSGTAKDPKTGKKVPVDPATFRDYKRLGAGLIGTVLYALAEWLRGSEYAGPEWYQVDTGKKGKGGEPLYWDLRAYYPLALFVQIADLNRRMRNKLMGDMEWGKELKEALSGMSKSPETEEWVTSMGKMWGGEEDGLWEKTKVGAGRQFSFTTRPFINLRDAYAAYSDEENKRKDLKGSGFWGPLVDNIPWLRGKYLPNAESMTGPEEPKLSEYPGTTFLGARFTEGENFAGREWRRLGLYNKSFMDPDPDPVINRAQNKYFRIGVSELGKELERDSFYNQANNEMKAALWEMFIGGDDGLASQARELGSMENPEESLRRGLKKDSGVGPKQRKAFGIDKAIEEALPKK